MTSRDPEVPPGPPPSPVQRPSPPATGADTVTVACKLPHGLILRCFAWEDYQEPSQNGGWRDARRAREIPEKRWTIRGTWVGSAGQAYARNNPAVQELLPGGYAITLGVPKEIWELWLEQNRNSALVRNRIVFAHNSHGSATDQAKEYRQISSGLEPIDREKPADRLGGVDRRLRVGLYEREPGEL